MGANPFLGVFFHWLGGLASGSFYVPYRFVKRWSWQTYWLMGGIFSWIIAPWGLGLIMTRDLPTVLTEAFSHDPKAVGLAYMFGAMWGLGGLTFGLTMRYLGMSLGMAVALSYCSAFGTLMPPIFDGTFVDKLVRAESGHWVLAGIVVSLIGIAVAGMAGMNKEREMSEEEKRETIKEFDFKKGILVATFSGIMSAGMSYGLAAAEPIAKLTAQHGTTALWTGLPKLVVVLAGGFTSNFIWCAILHAANKTTGEYFSPQPSPAVMAADEDLASVAGGVATLKPVKTVPLATNYLFSALAGVTWYFQFFFYTMGETQMGQYKFSSWTLHMSSIIIFSSLWGIALHEWKGSSSRTKQLLFAGLVILVGSTLVVGYGNFLAAGH